MPGSAIVSFFPCAAAGAAFAKASAAVSTKPVSHLDVVVSMMSSRTLGVLSLCVFKLKFGFARLAHQCAPHPLAQFSEARLAQGRARAWPRQVNCDGFVN